MASLISNGHMWKHRTLEKAASKCQTLCYRYADIMPYMAFVSSHWQLQPLNMTEPKPASGYHLKPSLS